VESLMDRADQALYKAKQAGRSRIEVADAESVSAEGDTRAGPS